jgi:hypothetical protein
MPRTKTSTAEKRSFDAPVLGTASDNQEELSELLPNLHDDKEDKLEADSLLSGDEDSPEQDDAAIDDEEVNPFGDKWEE